MVAANHSARLPQKQQDFWIHSDGLGDHVCAEISVSLGFKPAHVYCLSSLPTFCRLGWRTSNVPVLVMIFSHQLPDKLDHARSHDNTGIYLLWATPWQDQNCLSKCTRFLKVDSWWHSLSAVSSSTLCQIEPWEWTETIFRISLQQYYQVQVLYEKKCVR